jgi:hypothetical protein
MSIALSELVEELQENVPAVNGVPILGQYERAVTDAVADFGRRVGRKKFGTLNVVSGTATYDLPADFLKMISLPKLMAQHEHNGYGGEVLNTHAGLVPLPRHGFREETSIVNGQITFRPTPRYTLAREYSYKAGFALTEDDDGAYYYDELGEEEAGIIQFLAQSLAKGKLAAAAGGGISYKQGDVSVDTTNQSQNLFTSVDALKAQYVAAVENYIGTIVELG